MTTIAEYLAEQNTQQAEAYPSPGGDTAVAEMPDSLREYLRETRQLPPAPKVIDSREPDPPDPPDPYKARQKSVADQLKSSRDHMAIGSFETALEAARADPRFTYVPGETNPVNFAAEWAATVSTPVTAPGQTDLEAHAASVAQFRKQFGGTPEDVLQQRQDRQAAAPENNMRIEAMGRVLDRIGSPAWNAMGDQDRIRLIQQELDDPSLMDIRRLIEAHGDAGVNYKKLLPFFGGAYDAKELALLVQAALAIDDGTATPSQIDAIVHFSDAAEIARLRGNSILAGAVDIASVLPGMMLEFAATSGLYTLGAKLTAKGLNIILKRVLKKTIKNRAAVLAGKVAFKTTTMAGGSLVRGVGLPQYTVRNAMQRMLYDKETFFWAAIKAPLDTWIELFTEQTGESVAAVGKLVGKTKMVSSLLKGIKAWAKRHNIQTRNSTTKFLKAFADRTGYHGPIPEIGEEELGKILRSIVLRDPYEITGLRELASQGIAFSLLSGSGIALAGGSLLSDRIAEVRKANQASKRRQGGVPQAEAEAEAPAEASKKVKPPRTSSLAAWVADAEGAEHDPAFVAAIKAKIAKEPDNEYGILKEANASYEVFVQLKEHADVEITVTPEGEIKLRVVAKAKPVAAQKEAEVPAEAAVSPEAETGGREEYPALVSEEQIAAELQQQAAERERASTGEAPVEADAAERDAVIKGELAKLEEQADEVAAKKAAVMEAKKNEAAPFESTEGSPPLLEAALGTSDAANAKTVSLRYLLKMWYLEGGEGQGETALTKELRKELGDMLSFLQRKLSRSSVVEDEWDLVETLSKQHMAELGELMAVADDVGIGIATLSQLQPPPAEPEQIAAAAPVEATPVEATPLEEAKAGTDVVPSRASAAADTIASVFMQGKSLNDLKKLGWQMVRSMVRELAAQGMTYNYQVEGPSIELGDLIEQQAVDTVLQQVFGQTHAELQAAKDTARVELKVGDEVKISGHSEWTRVVRIRPEPITRIEKTGQLLYTVMRNSWNRDKNGDPIMEEAEYARQHLYTKEEAVVEDAEMAERRKQWREREGGRKGTPDAVASLEETPAEAEPVEPEQIAAEAPVEAAEAERDAFAKLQEQEDEAAQEGPHAPAQITVKTPEGGADLVADVVDPKADVAAGAHKRFLDKRIGDGEPVTIVRPDANHPQIAAAGALAQLFGKKSPKIVWFAGGNAGGYYSKARNTIYASIDMAHLKDGPLYSVIAHELTHFLELKHGGTFAALRAAIKSNPELFEAAKAAYLADAEASLPKVAALLSEDTDKARAALDSEGFAMVVMKAVQSGNFLAQLQKHPSLYQKVMDALAEFLMVMRIAPGLAERRYYKAVSLAFVNARTLEAKAKGKAKAKVKVAITAVEAQALTGNITVQQLEEAIAASPQGVALLSPQARLTPLASDYARQFPQKVSRVQAKPERMAKTADEAAARLGIKVIEFTETSELPYDLQELAKQHGRDINLKFGAVSADGDIYIKKGTSAANRDKQIWHELQHSALQRYMPMEPYGDGVLLADQAIRFEERREQRDRFQSVGLHPDDVEAAAKTQPWFTPWDKRYVKSERSAEGLRSIFADWLKNDTAKSWIEAHYPQLHEAFANILTPELYGGTAPATQGKGKAKATGKPEESAASLAAEYDKVPERKANPNVYDAVDEANIAAAEEEVADAQLFLDPATKRLSDLAFNNKLTPEDRKELGTIAEHAATLKKHRGSSMEDRVARKEAATRLLALVDALLLKKAQEIVAVHPTWIINDIFQKGRAELWRLLTRERKVDKTYAELAEEREARKRGELDPKTAGAKIQHVWWIMGYKVKGAPFKSYLLDSSSPVITAMRARKEEAGEKKETSFDPMTDERKAKDPRREIFTDKVASLWVSYKERGLSPEESMAALEVDILKLAEEEGVDRDDLAGFFLPKPAPKAHELDGLDPDVLRGALKAALLTNPGSTAIGRPELSMSTPPAMQAVDEARKQAGLPKPKTFDQWNAEGEAIVSDPAAKRALIAKVNRRVVLTPGETRAMENAIIPEMNDKITRAMLSGNITPGQLTKEEMLLNNYRYTGTEAGDILVSRRDPSETPAQRRLTLGGRAKVAAAGLQATPPGNITRDLEAAGLGGEGGKRPGGKLTAKQESATEALAAWHKDIQDMFARWAAAGINYRDMDKAIDKDPKKLRRVMLDITRIGEIHSEPGYFDGWVEHIRIAVLSGPLTHVRNLSGAIYGLGDILFFQPVASIVFRGEGWRPTAKSWRQLVSGRVWAQMVSNAWFSWINDGHNMFLVHHPGYFSNKSNEQLEEQHAPGITGRGTARVVGKVAGKVLGKKAGKQVGQMAALPVKVYGRAGRAISLAFMVAGDQLMTTMHATANVAGYAVVKAKKAGLKPGTQEHTDFVDGQILDPNSASWRDSGLNGETAIATFRDEAGWVEAKFQKWRRKFPPLNLLAPVVKFPFKLPRRLAGLLPTAGVYIAYRAARAQITSKKFRKDYSYREFSQDMAKWVIGAGLYVWFDAMDFADDDKKEGWRVTGPPQTLPKTSGQFQTEAEIIPPYSFWHIDENGVKSQPRNYRNIEPLSSVIATYVVYVDAIRDAKKGRMDKLDVAMKAYSRIQNMVAEIPTMQAIKQFVRVTDNPAGYWGIDFAGGVMNMHVWNAVRASEASTNDLVLTKRIRPGEDKVAALLKLSLYNVPFAEKMPPKVGIFGDDVKVIPAEFATTLETMAPDILDAVTLTRLFVPMRPYFRHTGNQGAMLEMLIDWDIDHPYDQRWITEPSDMVEVYMGEGYYKQPKVGLNNAEYYLYKKAAQTQFGILVEDVTWPEVATPGDLKLVEKMLEKSREGPLKLIKAAAQAKIDGDMDEYAKMLAELSDLAGL
jgi:hypothetical protein